MMAKNMDFLGTGWSFPPTFSRLTAAVEMVSDETDIHQSLNILFGTHLGERVMVPLYGCELWRMVFQALNTTRVTQIKTMVSQAILNWEPRINLDSVQVTTDTQADGYVLIQLQYTIRRTNTRSNFVYPFYLEEATIPAQAP